MASAKHHLVLCPACSQVLRVRRIVTDCDEGRRWWSDGCMDAGALPAVVRYAQCTCGTAFVLPGQLTRVAAADLPPGIRKAVAPDSDGYRALAEATQSTGNREGERDCRLAWWRHLNDARRSGHHRPRPGIDVAWQGDLDANLTRLAELLGASGQDDALLLGEVLRELGQFDRAMSVLTVVKPKERWAATLLANHAAAGNAELFGVFWADGGWKPLPPFEVSAPA